MIAIIDYGMGNLRSVYNALLAVGAQAKVASDPADLKEARAIILPGVGAFGDGIRRLQEHGWVGALEEEVRRKGKPFLGLCLGMQLLATTGTEHGAWPGLNWVPGVVERFPAADPTLRIPHIGWNDVRFARKDGLYEGMEEAQTFYFIHSYVFRAEDPKVVSGWCTYGVEFAASVESGNLWATQYHPEKSHRAGLAVLRNFAGRAR